MAGGSGEATLRFPSRGLGLTMSADPLFRHLMVYADPAKPVFLRRAADQCLGRLQSRGGFDDPDEGVIVLGPEETRSRHGRVRPSRPFRL